MTITGGRRPARAPPRTAAHLPKRSSCKSINNCTDSLPTSQNGHHYFLQCVILASKEGNFTHSTSQIRHHATSSSRGSGPLSSPPEPQLESKDGKVWGSSSLGLLDLTWTWRQIAAYSTLLGHSILLSITIAPSSLASSPNLHEGVPPTSMRTPALMKHELTFEPF
jgi:hypothetical protein